VLPYVPAVRATFCGVRGSTPAPGPEFVRIGGHTSCVAIAHDNEPPRLLLDAGTGIRRVPSLLGGRPFRGTILLTHLHWDHVQGIPFFTAGDRDDARAVLAMPAQGDPAAVLRRAMSPPHFPITPEGLRGDWSFLGLDPGEHEFAGFRVLAADVPHKGGRTYGYRVTSDGASLAYLPDHGPLGWGQGPDGHGDRHEAALTLARDVDVLVHGAQFTNAQRETAADFGHATLEYAVALAEESGARRLLLFHHGPARTDDEVDEIVRSVAGGRVPVAAAFEGMVLTL
jgi:phosphoribosyl 1,2-cyclic phosphodiesterase